MNSQRLLNSQKAGVKCSHLSFMINFFNDLFDSKLNYFDIFQLGRVKIQVYRGPSKVILKIEIYIPIKMREFFNV